jgi:hypothetical protein
VTNLALQGARGYLLRQVVKQHLAELHSSFVCRVVV